MSVIINGSAGVTTNSGAVYDSLQRATAVTASGTSVDFTSIPSWVRRITVMFSGVSTNGTSLIQIQLGDSGGIETTGYTSSAGSIGNLLVTSTTGFVIVQTVAAANTYNGSVCINLLNLSNAWVASGVVLQQGGNGFISSGNKTLSDTLTQVRITTANGTDTFDAGTINIIYE